MSKYIWWFEELDKNSLNVAGGKGANLGQMTQLGFPVPPGFAVGVSAYYAAIKANNLESKIKTIIDGIVDDLEDSDRLEEASREIKDLITGSPIPDDICKQIISAYKDLCTQSKHEDVLVAIRSSATAEDLPEASFAGQQSTFLNIRGSASVIDAVRECWASLFEARAIYYRTKHKFDHMRVGLCAVVQQMVQSSASGVMFTADPVNGRLDRIVIEAGWGLGEAVVSGLIAPDMYLLNKEDGLKILNKTIAKQTEAIIRTDSGETKETVVPKDKQSLQKLDDDKILILGKIGLSIEKAYGGQPQDIEWALDDSGEKIFIVQTRNITTLQQTQQAQAESGESSEDAILKGLPASPGVATGHVRLVQSRRDLAKVQPGDILVAHMTSPDYVPVMKRSGAIVTDAGGMTCHAAIVARELGIPCVVGTGSATTVLKANVVVTVDAHTGLVYAGEKTLSNASKPEKETGATNVSASVQSIQAPITATKLYVNIADPDVAERVAKYTTLCDGVGLIRAEFMISALGTHPNQLAKEGQSEMFISALAGNLARIAKAFSPRPVIYRANDFKSNEYRGLPGGEQYEPHEENPMIGYRGCLRYVTDPTVFEMEIAAIKKVEKDHGLANIKLMIPFVRTVPEFKKVLAMCPSGLQVGMMCEVPSNVFLCEEFCKAGAQFMSIGSNDLAQLILGADRDSSLLATDFDERNPAVLKAIRKVIRTCHKSGVHVSICGQMPSVYPETIQILVDAGIDGISVNPDVLEGTRRLLAAAEQKFIMEKLRQKN